MNHILPSNACLFNDANCVTTWMWKSNELPFDPNQPEDWTPYPSAISANIEQAYENREAKIRINENYLIYFDKMLQICINNNHQQRPVRRYVLSNSNDNIIDWRRERFAFKLDQPITDDIRTNTSEDDVHYYGSRFIADWLLLFTNGKLKVKFNLIFLVLVHGIQIEGHLYGASAKIIKSLINELEETRDNVKKKSEFNRMKKLTKCCAKLYTKYCFLFQLVNVTLRDDDRTKLKTLGPYCHLLYNYIGRRTYDRLSVRYRLRQQFHSKQTPSPDLYRDDCITKEKLDEYRQAAGQIHKYFRWLSFVSTSHKRCVGEVFARNVLYIIELRQATSNDQFVDLHNNTFMPHEKEVLLRPGVRFRVEKVTFC